MADTAPAKCRKGHWYSDANTILTLKKGRIQRSCRTCKRAYEREYKRRRYEDLVKPLAQTTKARARARGLAPDDPRHGTLNGYTYWGCHCTECSAANATQTRITVLKRKAKRLGIRLPAERNQVTQVSSLDGVADAWYGMDRVLIGSVWDDPTADEALSA